MSGAPQRLLARRKLSPDAARLYLTERNHTLHRRNPRAVFYRMGTNAGSTWSRVTSWVYHSTRTTAPSAAETPPATYHHEV